MTNLGQTLDEYQNMNGDILLSDLYYRAMKRYDGSRTDTVALGDLHIYENRMTCESTQVQVHLDDVAYEKMCSLLGIPYAYLMRLGTEMRKINIEYWFNQNADKEVEMTTKGDVLVELHAGAEIKVVDVLASLDAVIDGAKVFKVSHQKNSTLVDVYDENLVGYSVGDNTFLGGLRVDIKAGLKAPVISPIFIDVDSCGIVECSNFLEPLNIKSLSYGDILNVIDERLDNCFGALPRLFESMKAIWDEEVPSPRRRIALYCREHAVPDRVRAYALDKFDDSGFESATFGDIICLFGVMGYIDEVKLSSELRMQRLAGYIVMKAHNERRCSSCDATLVED